MRKALMILTATALLTACNKKQKCMNKIIILMMLFIINLSCENKAEQAPAAEEVQQTEKVDLSFSTTKERTYHFYSTADFVAASDPLEEFYLKKDNNISFDGSTVTVAGSDTTKYQVQSFEHSESPVFKDAGKEELYTITAKEYDEDGILFKWPIIITIAKVTAVHGKQTIVKVPRVVSNGEMLSLSVYTD